MLSKQRGERTKGCTSREAVTKSQNPVIGKMIAPHAATEHETENSSSEIGFHFCCDVSRTGVIAELLAPGPKSQNSRDSLESPKEYICRILSYEITSRGKTSVSQNAAFLKRLRLRSALRSKTLRLL